MKLTVLFLFAFTCIISAQEMDTIAINADRYNYQTGDHELFLMPTAHTMPERSSYFGSYELFLLNYTIAAGNSTHLGLYILPLPSFERWIETVTLTFLVKHTYYNTPAFSSAAFGMLNVNTESFVIGNTLSYELDFIGFHAGIGFARLFILEDRSSSHGVILIGAKAKICGWLRTIAEYSNTPSELYNFKDHFSGLGMAGLRYRDRHFVLDIAAAKLFGDSNNDVFPIVKAIVYF